MRAGASQHQLLGSRARGGAGGEGRGQGLRGRGQGRSFHSGEASGAARRGSAALCRSAVSPLRTPGRRPGRSGWRPVSLGRVQPSRWLWGGRRYSWALPRPPSLTTGVLRAGSRALGYVRASGEQRRAVGAPLGAAMAAGPQSRTWSGERPAARLPANRPRAARSAAPLAPASGYPVAGHGYKGRGLAWQRP